jgi:SAM-dependent methyltransferase
MLTIRLEHLGRPEGVLLDLGCGGGRHAFAAARSGWPVVAADMDELSLKQVAFMFGGLRGNGDVPAELLACEVACDAQSLPFRTECFRAAVVAEVMEHVPDDRAVLSELHRVLEPGGVLAVTVPRFYPELINWALSDDYHARPGGHVRIYRRSVLIERLRQAGFVPYASHHAHGLHSPYWWLRCLVGVDNDSHPLVKAYKGFLEREIARPSFVGRVAEAIACPIMGKSFVVYARRQGRA